MSDIFLSYARTDRVHAQKLAQALAVLGWSIFWDSEIRTAEDFEKRILVELQSAHCIVVLWSENSVRSDWVLREAKIGLERDRLLPIAIEKVSPPVEFQRFHTLQFQGGIFDFGDPEFMKLREDVVRLVGGEPLKRDAFKLALKNIASYGDTDVLPFPIEKQIFATLPAESLELLQRMDAKFDEFFLQQHPSYESSLYPVGFFGYRWVTHIDPIWNAYLLGLVTSLGPAIERVRVPTTDRVVFSYRFNPSEAGALFDQALGYVEYQELSLKHAANAKSVVVCDIADFYPRISHSRLEQALEEIHADKVTAERILKLLDAFSGDSRLGLPVGGPAARLLSELMLKSVDSLLRTEGIQFCRFADDYHIFADSDEQAHAELMFLSSQLFRDQGLTLQKNKTRIMSSEEFIATSAFIEPDQATGENNKPTGAAGAKHTDKESGLFRLKIKFDPYSPDLVAEYNKIRREVEKIDIEGMLARELAKSRVDPALFRKLVGTIRFLDPEARKSIVLALLQNLPRLYPLLSQVFRAFRDMVGPSDDMTDTIPSSRLDELTSCEVFNRLRALIKSRSYLMGVPAHMSYAIRVLAHDPQQASDAVLNTAFEYSQSMVRRDIILAMAKRGCRDWIRSRTRMNFSQFPWENRALLVASYILKSTGSVWRTQQAPRLSQLDRLLMQWVEKTMNADNPTIPI